MFACLNHQILIEFLSVYKSEDSSSFILSPLLLKDTEACSFLHCEPHTCPFVCVNFSLCLKDCPSTKHQQNSLYSQTFIRLVDEVVWGWVSGSVCMCVSLSGAACKGAWAIFGTGSTGSLHTTHKRWRFPCGVHAKCCLKRTDIKRWNVLAAGWVDLEELCTLR